jgi:hypothetical protein
MAAIRRRSARNVAAAIATLATADDVNGTVDGTQYLDVSGASVVIIIQENNGTAGTLGVDVIEESSDGGTTWAACDTLLLASANPFTGTVVASGALNAAGVEPVNAAYFKAGPFHGPTKLRCARGGTGAGGTAWTTGAPSVFAITVG